MDTEERVIPFIKSDGARGESSQFFDEKVKNGFFEKFIRPGTVVDVGYKGGNGSFEPLFTECVGLGTDTPGYNGRDFPYADDSIGTVLAYHVLEHIPDYGHFLREIFRVLKPGGTLILAVPLKEVYEQQDFPPSQFNPLHVRFYTAGRLLYELETSVPRKKYKISYLEEQFVAKELYRREGTHAAPGSYQIEMVCEKLPHLSSHEKTLSERSAENIVKAMYEYFLFRRPDLKGLKAHTEDVQRMADYTNMLEKLKRFSSSAEFAHCVDRFVQERLPQYKKNS